MQPKSSDVRRILILLSLAVAAAAPTVASGFVELGRAQQAQAIDDPAGAMAHFEKAAQRLPWRRDLWEQAGREALAAQAPGDAVRFLERGGNLTLEGWLALGDAYRQTGQPEQARAAYESALSRGASAEAYAGLAAVDRAQGDAASERAALENQLLLSPEDAAAHYRLGLLLSLTDPEAALMHLRRASQLDAEYEPVYQTLRAALALAQTAAPPSDRLVAAGRGLGLVGEWDLAAHAFEEAVQADQGRAEAWAWLGEAKQHLGQDASTDMQQAIALDDRSAIVRGLRGLYWKRLGDAHSALTEYQAAAAIEPDNPAWAASLGETYARLGDLVSALAAYERAARLAPGQSLYWRLLATFCVENTVQVQDVGLPAARKAVELAPDDPLALDVLGWSQVAAGQYDAAEQTLLAVVSRQPDFASARFHLALAYLQRGDRNAAYEQLRLALELDPNGPIGGQAAAVIKQYFP
ncbi:MAG: tetratricopeptide repeat protein [Bacteroidota bacterium]